MTERYLTEIEIREIVRQESLDQEQVMRAVSAGVENAFIRLGIGHHDPIEIQKDMAFLRRLRSGTTTMGSKAVVSVVTGAFTALVVLVTLGITQLTGNKIP